MNNRVVILTLTYNRPNNIKTLFGTLKGQHCQAFTWYIVDDGSSEDYMPVIEQIKREAQFDIVYERKENGGKSAAINYALDKLNADDFVAIIDDDEFLYPDAIEKLLSYEGRYRKTNIGLINFTRDDKNGVPMSKPIMKEDFVMSVQAHKRHKYFTDGYLAYFMDKLGKCRFPIFKGEKYVGPSVLMMLASKEHDILWSCTSLGYTDYLEGGLTKKGRQLRLKNPKGMAFRCLQMQTTDSGWKIRFIYSIQYFAYMKIAGSLEKERLGISDKNLFMPIVSRVLGFFLYKWWINAK